MTKMIQPELQARLLLESLTRDGELFLVNERSLPGLVPETARIISSDGSPETMATELAEWLLEQDAVTELMATDQEIMRRIIAATQ